MFKVQEIIRKHAVCASMFIVPMVWKSFFRDVAAVVARYTVCIYAFIYTFCHLFSFIIGRKTNFYVGIALTLTSYLICPFISVFLMLLM